MGSIADDLRRALREKVGAMSADERLAITERLAEEDIALRCAADGTDRQTARRAFARQRRAGRRPSRVMQEARE